MFNGSSLFSETWRKDPYEIYAALRENAPICFAPALGVYAVSRYEDVMLVLKDHASFSSEPPGFQSEAVEESCRPGDELARAIMARTVLTSDPPVHTRLRSVVSRAFTPARVAGLECWLRKLTRERVQSAVVKGEFDFVGELAVPLPILVIAAMFGIESERQADFARWSRDIMELHNVMLTGGDTRATAHSLRELREFLEDMIEQRRHSPGDDLLSVLIRHNEQDELSANELIDFVRVILVAGSETTSHLLGNAIVCFLRHPEEFARLRKSPMLLPNAIEEVLRYDTPVQGVFRTAKRRVSFSTGALPAGSRVFPLFGGANRDPRKFPDPERFDITRDTAGHVTLGYGIHYCVGAALARLEARVTLEEFLASVRSISFAPGQAAHIEYMMTPLLRGPRSLQLTVEPA